MKVPVNKIVDRYPHLRDGAARRQMLVRNAISSAQVEGIRPDEAQLQAAVAAIAPDPAAARPQ